MSCLISDTYQIKIYNNNISKVIFWTLDNFFNSVNKQITKFVILNNSTPFFSESILSTVFFQLPLELMFSYDTNILLDKDTNIICYMDKIGHGHVLLSEVKIFTEKNEILTEHKIDENCKKCLLMELNKPFSETMIPRLTVLVATNNISEKSLNYFSEETKKNNSTKYEQFEKDIHKVYAQFNCLDLHKLKRKLLRYHLMSYSNDPTEHPTLFLNLFLFGNYKKSKNYILNLLIMAIEEIKKNVNNDLLYKIKQIPNNIIKSTDYDNIPSYLLIYYKTDEITDVWKNNIIRDCDNAIKKIQENIE